jgi:hypothetical protein
MHNSFYASFNKTFIKSSLKLFFLKNNIKYCQVPNVVFFFFAKNHQKATVIHIFGNNSFCFKKYITRFCPFFMFWEESVAHEYISTYYIINGHIPNCHQLSWNLSLRGSPLLPHYKIEKQNIVTIMIDF